ncbi:unnamed protein product [Acanthoscelides obtectus]|uniref:Uncharacterized protein n=1 Tax=Acanthoscelides obtectus TaxID=200917 RepID=A0A9P0ME16_ACAOB|nr:unnamed protein product [Acanthoscelides obtectus]CAK1652232.1 hypothetical protein AOBTE_LOCUS17744 [Acanthoscelides obtectus]
MLVRFGYVAVITFRNSTGITAPQVRRLSVEKEETAGPVSWQVELLETLSQVAQQIAGGRRYSVDSNSKLPSSLFGRNRQEPVAAFPSSRFSGRVLPCRYSY